MMLLWRLRSDVAPLVICERPASAGGASFGRPLSTAAAHTAEAEAKQSQIAAKSLAMTHHHYFYRYPVFNIDHDRAAPDTCTSQ
jgi:hypothetical protein